MAEISNLRAGRIRRHAAFAVPCTLGALSLVGVAVRPDVGMRAAEQDLQEAGQRVEERRCLAARVEGLASSGLLQRAGMALEAANKVMPSSLPDLELHALVRLIAQQNGVELEAIELLAARDTGFEPAGDVVSAREIRAEGASSLAGLLGTLAAIERLGWPVSVLEFRIQRRAEADRYEWALALAMFETRSPTVTGGEGAASEEQG